VRTGAGSRLLATAEDIESFAEELSGLRYQSDPGPGTEEAGELFVFSTPFDRGLPLFLAARPLARAQVFRTVRGRSPAGMPARTPAAGPGAAPAGSDGRRLGNAATPVERVLFAQELADAFLPGPWVLRRASPPAVPLRAEGLEEVPLAVRMLP
jgi:hypothetical protein